MSKKAKNKNEIFENKLFESIKEVKNPVRNSIIVSLISFLLCIFFSIIIFFINDNSIIWNLNLGFSLMLAISLIWIMLKLGVLEGQRLRFTNWRNKKLISDFKIKKDLIMSLEEYRKINKQRSWIGIIFLSSNGFLGFLITLLLILI